MYKNLSIVYIILYIIVRLVRQICLMVRRKWVWWSDIYSGGQTWSLVARQNDSKIVIKMSGRQTARDIIKRGVNIKFTPCKFFFLIGKSRLRVIPFIYFISCLFIVYYSIPEVSSIGIQVYWAGIPEVSSARNFRQTGIPEVSSGVKKISRSGLRSIRPRISIYKRIGSNSRY